MAESRVRERETAFQLLFSAEFQKDTPAEEVLADYLEAEELDVVSEYVKSTFLGARAYREEALALALSASRGWSLERMSPAMRALLTLSLYEILKTDIPTGIAANEAVELAKRYEDEKGAKFLNGILGTISRAHAAEKEQTN
ncbi:MAG: transcription antitermination factor NusB [Clostridia bacterium]|nr:transcription antitermination factor NusB [Clostridia bacterium]